MRLRVATFNLENLDEHRRVGAPLDERIAVLRPQLLALRADVLCLQEVSAHNPARRTAPAPGARPPPRGDAVRDVRSRDEQGRLRGAVRQAQRRRAQPAADRRRAAALPRSRRPADRATDDDAPATRRARALGPPGPRGPPGVARRAPARRVRRAPAGAARREHRRAEAVAARLADRGRLGEGYLLAAIKRVGQALELRRRIDQLLDADSQARILVAGDLNAEITASALRILRADIEDTGNPALASRSLVALEEHIAEDRRYTVLHRGRRLMLDHLLASASSPAVMSTAPSSTRGCSTSTSSR